MPESPSPGDRTIVMNSRIRDILAIFWSVASATFLFAVVFLPMPAPNTKFADIILGFLLGTAVASILGFYFGSSVGSVAKDITISRMAEKNGENETAQ